MSETESRVGVFLHLVPYLHDVFFPFIFTGTHHLPRGLYFTRARNTGEGDCCTALSSPCINLCLTVVCFSLPFSLCLPEEGDRVAAKARPGSSADCPGAAKERTSASSPDGGVRVARSAAAYHGQYQRQILPHHGGTAVRPEHLTCHGLRL